jgi:hypothetical protein
MASTHIAAIAEIFRVRREKRLQKKVTWTDASIYESETLSTSKTEAISIWERTCAESFLYHTLTMTLFDRHFDPQMIPRTREMFDDYFLTCPLPTAPEASNWPILGMPYALWRLIADVSTLAKRLPLVDPLDINLAEHQIQQLGDWEQRLGIDAVGSPQFDNFIVEANPPSAAAGLYIFVAKILALRLLQSHPPSAALDFSDDSSLSNPSQLYIRRSLALVKSLDLAGVTFNRFYLWPLTILGCAAEGDEDVRVVREKLLEIRSGQSGAIGIIDWIRCTIEGIWEKTRRSSNRALLDEGRTKDGAGLEMLMQEIGD